MLHQGQLIKITSLITRAFSVIGIVILTSHVLLNIHLCIQYRDISWRQDSSLVAWLVQSPAVPGSSPAAANIFPWCTSHIQ